MPSLTRGLLSTCYVPGAVLRPLAGVISVRPHKHPGHTWVTRLSLRQAVSSIRGTFCLF